MRNDKWVTLLSQIKNCFLINIYFYKKITVVIPILFIIFCFLYSQIPNVFRFKHRVGLNSPVIFNNQSLYFSAFKLRGYIQIYGYFDDFIFDLGMIKYSRRQFITVGEF